MHTCFAGDFNGRHWSKAVIQSALHSENTRKTEFLIKKIRKSSDIFGKMKERLL
jgi:hypothetical protein